MTLTNAALDSMGSNPFAILTFIAAPALLTNSSSVLALGTSNRFARAVDRARALAAKLEATPVNSPTVSAAEKLLLHQLDVAESRVLIVVRALGAFYFAVGSFGLATLTSLLGAAFAVAGTALAEQSAQWLALAAGVAGVGALVTGSSLLVWESRLTRAVLHAEAQFVRRRVQERREAISAEGPKAAEQ